MGFEPIQNNQISPLIKLAALKLRAEQTLFMDLINEN